ncbi:MAG: NAD-dependent DNA ligase LigA [Acidobacteria bacterium]|nr:NAD-dependent DNA ligase LigA [Acidobacteriota bacterium]
MAGRPFDPKERIRRLTDDILRHRRFYYVENNPEISDREYDAMEEELAKLESQYPEFRLPWSPTLRVGGRPVDGFETLSHGTPMISLDNTYNREEVIAFDLRVRKILGRAVPYTVELKIDGLSMALHYEDRVLARAITRGDGIRGDNVLENARMIRNIPLKLPESAPEKLEIRGEVFMTFSRFEKLNAQRLKDGREPFANPRNAAAGAMRLKDPKETRARGLMMFGYHILSPETLPESQFQRLQWLKGIGFPVAPGSRRFSEIGLVVRHIEVFQREKDKLDFPVDGLVIKVDSIPDWERLGSTAKFPRYAVAYKFPAEQATTRVKAVSFQVGRTGVITPVAELEPVEIAGTTVQRATLHNFEEIRRKDIRVGDTVFIEKGGEIIPKVVKVVLSKRNGREQLVREPGKCPVCGADTVRLEGEVALRCINPSCPAVISNSILHFVSRDAMDIRGMGDALVRQLVEAGWVGDFADIYRLTAGRLEKLERMGKKSAENLVAEIEKSKAVPYYRVLYALGIRFVGLKSARLLAGAFPSVTLLRKAGVEDLAKIDGIGNVIAQSVARFFALKQNREMLGRLADAGLNLEGKGDEKEQNRPLEGRTYVLTGELAAYTRKQARELLESLGANVSSSVSRKTTAVIAGAKPGSKRRKAEELGITILDESFLTQLKQQAGDDKWTAD